MAAKIVEKGVVVGNIYDKYGTRNPIARTLVRGFLTSFDALVSRTDAKRVLEVGCGEGELSLRVAAPGRHVIGTDISALMIAEARRRANTRGLEVRFEESALLDLRPAEPDYDLVICCEVLEHVEDPEAALRHLKSLCRGHLLFSVPREPIWRVLNVVRGKYLRTFGNTPGHLQHWSAAAFRAFLRQHVRVVKYLTPFPWSMALCRSEPADDNRRRRPGPENA